jgi:eukaryotic-like serine/threonine-protein kinase
VQPKVVVWSGAADVRGAEPRLPLRVRVTTNPPLVDCWSVNVSSTGIGLRTRAATGMAPLRRGASLEMSFGLPDGPSVSAVGSVMWSGTASGGASSTWTLGVRFDRLEGDSQAALEAFLRGNRARVAVAYATKEEAEIIESAIGAQSRLFFAETPEQARTVAARGDIAVMAIFGDAQEAAALTEWMNEQFAPSEGDTPGPGDRRPRVIYCAPVSSARLVDFFNSAKVFRWLPPPLAAAPFKALVDQAFADFSWHAEREHIAVALTSERQADWKKHLRVMLAAVQRRLLDRDSVDDVLGELVEGQDLSLEELWVLGGRLRPEDLAEIVAALPEGEPRAAPPSATPSAKLGHTMPLLSLSAGRTALAAPVSVTNDASAKVTKLSISELPDRSSQQQSGTAGTLLLDQQSPGSQAPKDDGLRYADPQFVGEGGMGVVVSCIDTRLGRRVALKRMRQHLQDKPELAFMLEREARVTGGLEHPNIIPVYDAGRTHEGSPFYVMKLVQEPTLADIIERLRTGHKQTVDEFSLGRLLRHFVQVCQAVDYAHDRAVIHCDLKPANVLLGSFGQVLVVDWGLAYLPTEGTVFRGGTFGYAAPEQLEQSTPIGPHTDVYALGSILYELLSLQPPFPDQTAYIEAGRGSVRHPGRPPRPAREIAPERRIPEELDEICLRALAVAPEDRFSSAGSLAAAVESFLEGTKERERRQRRADELVTHADQLADNYFELVVSRPERIATLEALRASIAPWEPPERKSPLWDEEDAMAVTDTLTVRTMQAAAAAYEQALEEVRNHPGARRGLARLYASELNRAEERGDEHNRIYFEELVRQFDDGTIERATRGEEGGSLSVECQNGEAEVHIARVEEQSRRLVPMATKVLGKTPLRDLLLTQGSYSISLHVPGLPAVRIPLSIKADTQTRIFADIGALEGHPLGEVLVPGGTALLGGDDSSGRGRETREVFVPSFFIQELPVSFREYLAFLRHAYQGLGKAALQLSPRHGQAPPFWSWNGEDFVCAEMRQWGDDVEELLELPVFGVDQRCAEAYAEWWSMQTNREYRLPTEDQWEKAARGTDGRRFPWGNHFDASFCCMRESKPGTPRPSPRGRFEADTSPFGVRDTAGSIADWTLPVRESGRPSLNQVVARGGAWCDWRVDCVLTARRPYRTSERTARVGFRLVRPGPEAIGYSVSRRR